MSLRGYPYVSQRDRTYVLVIVLQGSDPWTALPILAKSFNLLVESKRHRALSYGERTNTFLETNQLELPYMFH